ncbi:MAG: phosphoribosylformylglycinamidine synthase [Pseudomonadota bacterium]|nr:phosphoribosylformylglycinamidine synthase [Pseudomonadota bacterium]
MTTRMLLGQAALSDFRLERLNTALAEAGSAARVQASAWVYLVDADDTVDWAVLEQLLPGVTTQAPEGLHACYVLPRSGTLSPWSSKATDIARVCGLDVRRLERGRLLMLSDQPDAAALPLLHDRMTEQTAAELGELERLFAMPARRPLRHIPLGEDALTSLRAADAELGLALSEDELEYLADFYRDAARPPTDAELMMFAQINSEHCRHKIFNARFTIDGEAQDRSLFDMIRASYAASPGGILSAYKDNAAVLEALPSGQFRVGTDPVYALSEEPSHISIKVETHNHPTAISPDPGAATGAGGEIRDEAATGRGGYTKAGLCGFSVSNLKLPGMPRPWEVDVGKPGHMASALQIMLEGPIGAASYNNEFGRPNLTGYFRSFEQTVNGELRGYHKPIMIAGGLGSVRDGHVEKLPVPVDAKLIVLGGPAMLIGLGGGAASSVGAGEGQESLDFASVQRANPEMQRRAQEVIDRCCAQGASNPILSIHDVGAGGISNALPEIIDEDGRGGLIRLSDVHSADPSLSPMEIWSNESQERYVLAIAGESLAGFTAIAERERCPFAVVGEAKAQPQLEVLDHEGEHAVDMPMPVLLGKTPKMHRDVTRLASPGDGWAAGQVDLSEAIHRVLRLPSVGSKQFLITIGDRCITGLVARDQMVGPWQTPVADCAVTAGGYTGHVGEAMAMGERTPVALLNAPASGRMAVGEAITNLLAADVPRLDRVRLSANWMAACGEPGEDARLFDAVRAVGAELCPALGVAIPVGKDSLSMRTRWQADGQARQMSAPMSLIVTAFSAVEDVRQTLTPELSGQGDSWLLLVTPAGTGMRLGASALTQVYGHIGDEAPDLDDPAGFKAFVDTLIAQRQAGRLLAYHDRSDGGLLATLLEMAFASRCGLDIDLAGQPVVPMLFNEELGVVIEVRAEDRATVEQAFIQAGAGVAVLGQATDDATIRLREGDQLLFEARRAELQQAWAETSWQMQRLRDNPAGADAEYAALEDDADPGLHAALSFDVNDDIAAPFLNLSRPRVAVLREQGVNSAREMAFAFHAAGFEAVDVHMSDLLDRGQTLDGFAGLVAPGGFSYGDVLGAGRGWAGSIRFHAGLAEQFRGFAERDDRFLLGICNGCQMMAELRDLIPGAEQWPHFVRNASEQFEGRVAMVQIPETSDSLFLDGMQGSRMPVAVSHGEGRALFASPEAQSQLTASGGIALQYVDNRGAVTQSYPANPNGSPAGIAGVTAANGRALIMMPHPERVIRSLSNSWRDPAWGEYGPWMRMFRNARRWVG